MRNPHTTNSLNLGFQSYGNSCFQHDQVQNILRKFLNNAPQKVIHNPAGVNGVTQTVCGGQQSGFNSSQGQLEGQQGQRQAGHERTCSNNISGRIPRARRIALRLHPSPGARSLPPAGFIAIGPLTTGCDQVQTA